MGETEGYAWEPTGGAVIDTDVLWSCVTCGACVNQCPVDIEHVDHIIDMRRYQVLVESNFPAELNGLFKGMENKGNPWNMSATARMDWAKDLPFEVKVVGGDGPNDPESLDEVEWLFWVGCAGAYEDRAKKTTRAVAELLDMAGVTFGVLGNGETCTGDSARRAGNEFLFQGLAQQNVETFKEYKVKKVVSTCAHCFNTLKNEYKEFGIELEVVHHTQLLNRLVREGKLTPIKDGDGAHQRSITYHDPCYIGRHNGVYSPPRELLQVLPGAELVEMERNSERSFCCGAGGARMWMEETIGERINNNRTNEAVATGADQIAVGCPFCRVMLSDGLTAAQSDGTAREEVEVLDVAQMLLASVKGEVATRRRPGEGGPAAPAAKSVETKAEPEAGDVTQTEDTVTATEDVGPAAKASGGTSLFDTPGGRTSGGVDGEACELGWRLAVRHGWRRRARKPEKKAEPRSEGRACVHRRWLAVRPRRRGRARGEEGARRSPARPSRKPARSQAERSGGAEARGPGRRLPFDIASSGASVSEAATQAASDESPSARRSAEQAEQPEPEGSPKPRPSRGRDGAEAEQPDEKPKPASSGEAHQPKTDADINESGSLFDL